MVDDQVHGQRHVDARRVAALIGNRRAHGHDVDQQGQAQHVLKQQPGRTKRYRATLPRGDMQDGVPLGVLPHHVFRQHAQRIRQLPDRVAQTAHIVDSPVRRSGDFDGLDR